jgi:ribosomal protein S18 acetylase RimI-like enzyme
MSRIKELKTISELSQAFLLAYKLYPQMKEAEFIEKVQEMLKENYRILGVVEGEKIIAIVGYRVGLRLYCGKYLHIDNLIVAEDIRQKGLASELIEYLKDLAKKHKCNTILADTQLANHKAQKLFLKNGFYMRGFHMKCDEF